MVWNSNIRPSAFTTVELEERKSTLVLTNDLINYQREAMNFSHCDKYMYQSLHDAFVCCRLEIGGHASVTVALNV
jgi:hypothetical protein